MNIRKITGTITMSDGSVSEFSIFNNYGWQQWGADRNRLGQSVDVVEALVQGLMEAEVEVGDEQQQG